MTRKISDNDKVLNKLFRHAAGRFNCEMQLKAHVAYCYARDGEDFLERFSSGWESERNNRSYRTKLFIDLRMAVECFLKGLIVAYCKKTERPEDAYQAARGKGHYLDQLLIEVQSRSMQRTSVLKSATLALVKEISGLKVDLRYELNMVMAFATETFRQQICEDGPMTGTIGSDAWMLNLFQHVKYISKKSNQVLARNLGKHRTIRMNDMSKLQQRMNQFAKDMKLL